MSDSLKGTCSVIPLVSTNTMNAELPLLPLPPLLPAEPDPDALPAPAPPPPAPEAAAEEEADEPLVVPLLVVPPATVSPGEVLATEATVPEIGASSLVRSMSCSADCTWRLALSTPAWAAARFACSSAGLVVGVGAAAAVVVLAAVVVPPPLGEVGAAAAGAFFVACGWDLALVLGLAGARRLGAGALAAGAATTRASVAVLAVGCWPVFEVLAELDDDAWLVDPLGLASTCASLASADSRLARACSRAIWALRGSSSASSSPPKTCWPGDTETSSSVPPVGKLRLTWLPACRVPLPETVDWTTPFSATTMRCWAGRAVEGGPTTRIATTTAATQGRARASLDQSGVVCCGSFI